MPRGGSVNTKLFLGNLPPGCKVKDIEKFFEKFGKVRNILIKQGKYGFAEFEDRKYAEEAVYDLQGKRMLGSRITLEFAKGPKKGERRAPWVSKYGAPSRSKYGIKVFNLSSRISWQDLKDIFRKAGEVCFAEAHVHRRNEGRVEVESTEDLERIIKRYQGYEINGRRIELERDIQDSKSNSRSRSRSNSRKSNSRSHSNDRSKTRSQSREGRQTKSHSNSRSRSRSNAREIDPDDQDVKRQRKRSNSRDSRNSKRTRSSRSESNKSPSPTRKQRRTSKHDIHDDTLNDISEEH